MSPRRTLVAATAFLGLVFAGSAASAIPIRGVGQLTPGPNDVRERLRTQFEQSFGHLELTRLKPGVPGAPASTADAGAPNADPFPGLGAGEFAGYASATVNHTAAHLVGKDVDHDVNLASSHAAHSQAAVPPWANEIGRTAFPALSAGSSHGQGLAAELSEPDSDEADSILPLDPAVANAPPSSSADADETPVNAPPALKSKALRAQASARAVKTGCVLGSDLALARANADDTDIADVKGDPKSPAPLLSLNGDEPPRGVAQSLARTRLIPIAGQPNHFGVMAETRQTVAPVTFFNGAPEEMTIEVAGEWVLRAVTDGAKGSLTLAVERSADDDRPLVRIITRDPRDPKKKVVTSAANLDEFSALDQGVIRLSNGARLVIAEPIRALRGDRDTPPVQTGTRVAGALDILRLQASDDPADTIARIGHMEAAVAAPPGGATCPGIGIVKRSSQPTVDAGGRFSWVLDISNPNDCVLDNVKLVDTTQPSKGIAYTVVSTSPEGKVSGDTVTFEGIGPLQPGAHRSVRIDVEVDPGALAGRFTNQAVASGVCGTATVSGATEDETVTVDPPTPFDVIGRSGANEPAVRPVGRTAEGTGGSAPSGGGDVLVRPAPLEGAPASPSYAGSASTYGLGAESARRPGQGLATTGGATTGLAGIVLCGLGVTLRRLGFRRRQS